MDRVMDNVMDKFKCDGLQLLDMLLIVEGLDNLGKTTFAKTLSNTFEIKYVDYPIPSGKRECDRFRNAVDELLKIYGNGEDITIVDRSIISSIVYDTILFSPFSLNKVLKLLKNMDVKVLTFLPDKTMIQRVMMDDDMQGKDYKHILNLIERYKVVDASMQKHGIFAKEVWINYDSNFTPEKSLKYAKYFF